MPFARDDNQKASSPTADLPYLYDYRRPERRHPHHVANSLWDSYHVNLSRDLDWDGQIAIDRTWSAARWTGNRVWHQRKGRNPRTLSSLEGVNRVVRNYCGRQESCI